MMEDNAVPINHLNQPGISMDSATVPMAYNSSDEATVYYDSADEVSTEPIDSDATDMDSIDGSDQQSDVSSLSDIDTSTDNTLVAGVPPEDYVQPPYAPLVAQRNEQLRAATTIVVEGLGQRNQFGRITTVTNSGDPQPGPEPAERLVVRFQSLGSEGTSYQRLVESDTERVTTARDQEIDDSDASTTAPASPLPYDIDNVAPADSPSIIEEIPREVSIFEEVRAPTFSAIEVTHALTPPQGEKRKCMSPSSDEEGQICSICFEPWTNSGSHRLSALRCGHLFGQSCIAKWLKGKNQKCPQCNMKARPSDIRVLYAKSVKVIDTVERDRALQELEKEREARRRLEVEMAQTRLKCQLTERMVQELEKELRLKQAQVKSSANQNPEKVELSSNAQALQLNCEMVIEVCKENGGRVMASCDFMSLLVASKVIPHNLFPGYGVKKINTGDFNCRQNVFIHTKCIRDMAFNPVKHDGILLTASMDKTVRLTSMLTNSCVQVYHIDAPAWSVSWNEDNNFQFFVGLQNGYSFLYDTRQTHTFVKQISVEGSRSPAASLQYVKLNPLAPFSQSGLLVTQFDRCVFYELQGSEFKPHFLPIEGPLTWTSFDQQSRHLLASCRPSAKHLNARHLLCELTSANDPTLGNTCTCNVVQTFEGGSSQVLLSRSALIRHPQRTRGLLACAGDETSNAVLIWDVQTTRCIRKLAVASPVLDLCPVIVNNNKYLATLGTKDIHLYKFS